jgi:glycosyltransferase involved in cell wall biosynthesis
VPQQEVMRGLARACIAVLPNRDDPDSRFTSPIKLFEYMAAGCAIVASDLPPLRAVLAEDEAVWVRPGDPGSLAEGIRRLAADPERARRMGERAREKARGFTWRARAERLADLLRAI